MIEFNPDGSIKLPGFAVQNQERNKNKMQSQRCLKITREIVSDRSPKKCNLTIELSNRITDNRFVTNIHNYFRQSAEVPSKITRLSEKRFQVEIGTCFRRCSDCNSLIRRYREFVDNNVIEEKGGCQYEGRKRNFSYEDYFD